MQLLSATRVSDKVLHATAYFVLAVYPGVGVFCSKSRNLSMRCRNHRMGPRGLAEFHSRSQFRWCRPTGKYLWFDWRRAGCSSGPSGLKAHSFQMPQPVARLPVRGDIL